MSTSHATPVKDASVYGLRNIGCFTESKNFCSLPQEVRSDDSVLSRGGNSSDALRTTAQASALRTSPSYCGSVLVVDDEETVASVIARYLRQAGFEAEAVGSGHEALERLAARRFDALLTDIHMPRLRGDELQRLARAQDPDLAVLLITATDETACAVACLKEGVFDYLTKPCDLDDVATRVLKALEQRALIRENRAYRQSLESKVEAQAQEIRRAVHGTLKALIHALEAKDPNTRNHSTRVACVARKLARRVRPGDEVFANRVFLAGLLHDIGKIGIPEAILGKRGRLTDVERCLVQEHPRTSATILTPILDAETVAIVRGHHEHFDGNGYPDRLAGECIPMGARIIAVADAYDAMTSARPYRDEISRGCALETLRTGAGTQWDGMVVAAILTLVREEAL